MAGMFELKTLFTQQMKTLKCLDHKYQFEARMFQ